MENKPTNGVSINFYKEQNERLLKEIEKLKKLCKAQSDYISNELKN